MPEALSHDPKPTSGGCSTVLALPLRNPSSMDLTNLPGVVGLSSEYIFGTAMGSWTIVPSAPSCRGP